MSFSSSKLFEDDDDDLQGSSRKSNLGNIFGAATQPGPKESSLRYERPKAPSAKPEAAAAKSSSKSGLPAILHTTKVDLYDKASNEYKSVGAAIIENSTGQSRFNLVLYFTRDKIIAAAPITRDFAFTIQFSDGVNFGSFYDTNGKDWSFRFLKPDDAEMMAIHLVIAKHYEEPGQILTQEIGAATKGAGAAKDDILGVRFVSYTQKAGKLSDPTEDNTGKPQPLKYVVGGANKTGYAGWEVGLDGLKRGGKRILLVPASEGGSSEGATIYKIFLEKMKRAAGNAGVNESAPSSGKIPKASSATGISSGDEGGHDGPEPGSSPEHSSAILQRMSKMAVATPFAGAVPKSTAGSVAESTATVTEATETPAPVATTAPAPAPAAAVPVNAAAPQQYPQQQPQQQPIQPQQANFQPQLGSMPNYPMPNTLPNMYPGATGYGAQGYPGSGMYPGAAAAGQFGLGAGSGPAGLYGGQNALSLYNPQQNAASLWEMYAAHGGFPLGPPKPAASPAQDSSASASKEKDKDILSQAEAIQLLIDGRQFQSEIKTSLTKMSTQLEDVEERLEGTMFTKNKDLGGGVTAKVLLQTIARIVGENERMLAELSARDERIEHLTSKFNKLHETNQRVIDENNRFMEERTSNFKTATDSQIRQLEQFREEKTALEMELTSANRQFQTLKRSFTNVSNELETLKEEMERLKADRDTAVSKYAGVADASQSAESKLIDEQSAKRKLELDVQQLRDELAIEREATETLRREAEERKVRYNRETANIEAHHLAEKAALDDQVAKLQEVLRKERATLGASSEAAQAEIESKWTARFKADLQRATSALEAEWEQKFEQHKATIVEEARERMRQIRESHAEQTASLQAETEAERTTWREKEQGYRRTISQLQEVALSSAEAQEVIARLRGEIAESAAASASSVKSIMNQVYLSLNELFEDGEQIQYDKSGIMDTLKRTIVSTTKKLINPDEELPEVPRPVPVAPIEVRVEVPVEVRVEVPVETTSSSSNTSPSASSPSVSGVASSVVVVEPVHSEIPIHRVERIDIIEEPLGAVSANEDDEEEPLSRVDSEISVSTTVKQTAAATTAATSTEDSTLEDDPLAPPKPEQDSEDEATIPAEPPQPVDAGWESGILAEHEPDFVQPVEEEPQTTEPTTSTAAAATANTTTEEESSTSAVEEDIDPLSASASEEKKKEEQDSTLEDDPLSAAAPVEDDSVEENPLSSSNHKEEEEHVENPLANGHAHTDDEKPTEEEKEEKKEEIATPIAQVAEEEVQKEEEKAAPAVVDIAEPLSTTTQDEKDAIDHISTPAAVAVAAEDEKDDDPFGLGDDEEEQKPAPVVESIPVAQEATNGTSPHPTEDEDPFGLGSDAKEEEQQQKPEEKVESPAPAPEASPAPVEHPNFFLDEPSDKTNGDTPKKKASSFFDDDEPEETPKKSVPATEPKKKTSSFFDDDDDIVPAKKAPSSASKAASVFGDDDDSFGLPKPTKKSDSALDDIFGGISSKGSSTSKGLFDD